MRWFGWFRKHEPMTPGICECDHERCCHVNGIGGCTAEEPPDKEWPNGSVCACQIYIRAKDDGGDDSPDVPTDPAVKELERMLR